MTVLSSNLEIHIKLLLPLEFDNEVYSKYPLIIEAQSPENGVITDKFNIDWSHYWVSKHEYIYGWVESDNEIQRHRKLKHNYDLINENIINFGIAMDYIKNEMHFIDANRICIWGSNLGAFIAISSLASNEILKCAVLVSPVINWRLMDAVTYEHLFNPQNSLDNNNMFESISLINKINKLIAKPILFIHGSANVKVPIQHTMQIIKQFIIEYSKNGWNAIQPLHQIQIYPDEDNSMQSIRHHMHQKIQIFFEQIFSQNNK